MNTEYMTNEEFEQYAYSFQADWDYAEQHPILDNDNVESVTDLDLLPF